MTSFEAVLSELPMSPIYLSLKSATIAVFLLIVPSFFLALWVRKKGVFSYFLDTVVQVPLVLPPVVVGYSLLYFFGPQSSAGSFFYRVFGFNLAFSFWATVVAGFIVGLPFMVKSIQTSLDSCDVELPAVVESLGINRHLGTTLLRLIHSWKGVLRGSLLAFSRCFGEFGATVLFAANIPQETRTVPLAIYSFSEQANGSNQALFLCLVSISFAFSAVFMVRLLSNSEQKASRTKKGN